MSLRFSVSMFACGFAAVMGILFAGSPARVQTTYYWTTSAGAMTAGSGTWDTATPNWSTTTTGDATLSVWSGLSTDNADFYANSSPTSAITVNGNQSVGNVTFDGTGYTVGGAGALTVAGSITANQNATINAVIGGTNLVTGGNGVLTLGGGNTYSGATVISAGTLQLNGVPAPQVAFNFNSSSGTASGSTVYNAGSLSSAYNGTLSYGASIASGVGLNGGNAMSLAGGSAPQLRLTNNLSLSSGNWTASAWFYGLNGNQYNTLFAGNENQVLTNWSSLGTYLAASGFQSPAPAVNMSSYLGQSTWNQITAVGSGGSTSFYINGNLAGSINAESNSYISAVGNWTNGGQQFAEYIDDVNIYQSALSAAQVQLLYNNGVLPAQTPVQIAAGATLDLNGSAQQVGSLNDYVGGSSYGAVTNGAAIPATLTLAPTGGTATFTGSINDGSGGVSLAISGSGTQVLSGTNAYTGGTVISNGTLVLANSAAAPLNSNYTVSSPSGLAFGTEVTALTIGGLSGNLGVSSGTGVLALTNAGGGAVSLTFGGNNASATFYGSLSGTGNLTKTGSGLQCISANYNTALPVWLTPLPSGQTTVSAGTLEVQGWADYLNGGISIAPGATFQADVNYQIKPTSNLTISGSGTLLKTSPGDMTLGVGSAFVSMAMGAGGLIDIENGAISDDYNYVPWGANKAAMKIASGAVFDIRARAPPSTT